MYVRTEGAPHTAMSQLNRRPAFGIVNLHWASLFSGELGARARTCHAKVGLILDRIVGAPVAGDPSFSGYSSALRQFSVDQPNWTEQALNAFLQSPKSLVPGTYMGFDGIGQSEDRVAVITYLKSRL